MRNWTRSEATALADVHCGICFGLGASLASAPLKPCPCVLRAIWRICYARYREAGIPGALRPALVEYAADFQNVARRTLGRKSLGYELFKYHYLLGRESKQCAHLLRLDRQEFRFEALRIQQKLGRAYRDTTPFALYPIDTYFSPPPRGLYRECQQSAFSRSNGGCSI